MRSGVQRPHPLTPVPQNRNSETGATGTKLMGPTRPTPGDGQCASAAEVAATLRDREDERDRQKELTSHDNHFRCPTLPTKHRLLCCCNS